MNKMKETILRETKYLRGWNGNLKRINERLTELADTNKMTKTETDKFNTLIYRYYRFFNDGDIPRGRGFRYESYALSRNEQIGVALELKVTKLFKELITKYGRR
jgi:hypothetical protein